MQFGTWDEIRIAYHVARAGTVSGAAEALGVHHATVIRHVDALEARLGVRLFQRHARGYTITEAGADLLRVARDADDQFQQLAARISGSGGSVSGAVVVTVIPGLAPLVVPALARLQAEHPETVLTLRSDRRVARLEYGEAQVAIRAGNRPDEPDNVVQPLATLHYGLFAAAAYAHQSPLPAMVEALAGHRLIGPDDPETLVPFLRWLGEVAPRAAQTFRSDDPAALDEAVQNGLGIGFMPLWRADGDPGLCAVLPDLPPWEVPLWLVTHMDLHRTAKVQAVTAALREAARGWSRGRVNSG